VSRYLDLVDVLESPQIFVEPQIADRNGALVAKIVEMQFHDGGLHPAILAVEKSDGF
jgi:hypothetical protein